MELEVELTEVEQRPQGQAGAPATREEEATQVRGPDRAAGLAPPRLQARLTGPGLSAAHDACAAGP